jgi:hypothetical protein
LQWDLWRFRFCEVCVLLFILWSVGILWCAVGDFCKVWMAERFCGTSEPSSNSLEQAVIPNAHASSFVLQYFRILCDFPSTALCFSESNLLLLLLLPLLRKLSKQLR